MPSHLKSSIFGASSGLGLVALALLVWQAGAFAWPVDLPSAPLAQTIALEGLATVAFLLALISSPAKLSTSFFLLFLLAGGLLRLGFLCQPPLLEDDFYRYLFDGALWQQGISPYLISPFSAAANHPLLSQEPQVVETAGRIFYSTLTSPYPSFAEAFFLLAHLIAPWSDQVWRALVIAGEGATLGLLIHCLRRHEQPRHWCLIYWLNPLVLLELSSAGHLEGLLLPFLLLAYLGAERQNYRLAGTALALASGIKIWPLVLLPLLVPMRRKNLMAYLLAGGLAALLLAPLVLTLGAPDSGLAAFARIWRMNDTLFRLPQYLFGPTAARAIWLVLTVVVVIYFARRSDLLLAEKLLWTTFLLLILGPVLFPWYGLWFLPWLVLAPRLGPLLIFAGLTLSDLRFYFSASYSSEIYDHLFVWLLLGPGLLVCAAGAWGAYVNRRRKEA